MLFGQRENTLEILQRKRDLKKKHYKMHILIL